MRPTVATVLSPRPWEGRLVEAAAATGLVRVVARCFESSDLPDVDAIVAGSEAPWLGVTTLRFWKRQGIVVVGMFPLGDRPAIELFCRANVDQLYADVTDPLIVLRAIREMANGAIRTR